MKIERHPAVVDDDLPGIYAYIARDDPAAAERVLDAIADSLDQIVAHPESGIPYPSMKPSLRAMRMLPVSGINPI